MRERERERERAGKTLEWGTSFNEREGERERERKGRAADDTNDDDEKGKKL